jgi:hypothetical protein
MASRELGVLGFSWLQDGDDGVGVFLPSQETLIGVGLCAGSGGLIPSEMSSTARRSHVPLRDAPGRPSSNFLRSRWGR